MPMHGVLTLRAICFQALATCKMHPNDPGASNEQSIVWLEEDTVCFRTLRRKNKPKGSGVLKRICSCRGGCSTCAVHTLWHKFFANLPDGARPWSRTSAGHARDRLRKVLHKLQVPDADSYGTQDFRRGHAEVWLTVTSPRRTLSCAAARI